MISRRLKQILCSTRLWPNKINQQLCNEAQILSSSTNWWYSSRSQTLNNALRSTLSNSYAYNGGLNGYKILYTICALLKNNMRFRCYDRYIHIPSDLAQELKDNPYAVLNTPRTNATEFNLIFYHIPKGKSYLREVLDNMSDLDRLKPIEALCIESPTHFVRVYKNFNSTGENSITIFSDTYTDHMINTLFMMLPHLMNINTISPIPLRELTEEEKAHNARVDILHKIFGYLYEIMKQSTLTEYTNTQQEDIENTIATLIDEYAGLFDFTKTQLDSFTKRLAKARNDNALKFTTNELERTKSRIAAMETDLESLYLVKTNLERQLIAFRMLSEHDIAPLIDTIKNTKAIEVMSATDAELVLRITAPLQYFESADFEAYERNPGSYLNDQLRNQPTLRKVLHKVFITREYQILFQGIIHMQVRDNYNDQPLQLFAERNGSNPYTQFPNPHLYHHNCWGKAQAEMQKNTCEGNFELVVMQMVAAVQSMNVAENPSFNHGFLYDIMHYDNLRSKLTFIVDGEQLNYQQMIEYENELEKQQTIQQAQTIIEQAPREAYTQVEIPDSDDNWDTVTLNPMPGTEGEHIEEEDEDDEED